MNKEIKKVKKITLSEEDEKEEKTKKIKKPIKSNSLIQMKKISELSEKEKKKLISLIDSRYPTGDTLFFLVAYNLNPLRGNQTYLKSCTSYIRLIMLLIFLLFEVTKSKIGLFMIPLFFENFALSVISFIRFIMENFKERKTIYFFMFLSNLLNFSFVVKKLKNFF